MSVGRLLPLSFLLLAGCVAAAWAGSGLDQVRLKDGRVVEGRIVGTRDGAYWMELPTGELVSFPFSQIDLVERATDSPPAATSLPPPAATSLPPPASVAAPTTEDELYPVPPEIEPPPTGETSTLIQPPAPELPPAPVEPPPPPLYVEPPEPPSAPRRVDRLQAGFDVLTVGIGPRLAYQLDSPIIDSVGVRGGVVTGVLASGFYSGHFSADLFAAVAVDWIGGSPVQIETTLGPALHMMYYPGMVLGVAARIEPRGHIQLNVGALVSFSLPYSYYPLVIPDLSASFVW